QNLLRIRSPSLPQLRSVIAVERDFHAACVRRIGGSDRRFSRALAQRRGDARQVKQLRSIEQLVPVEIALTGSREAAAFTVVDDGRWAQPRSGREEIQAHASACEADVFCRYAVSPQVTDRCFAERVLRQAADHRRLMAKTS